MTEREPTDLVTTLRHWVEALRTQQIADTTVADIALFNGGCVSDDIEAAADEIERMRADRLKLDRRIHNQRVALRQNWQIIEMRAQWTRAWYPSRLLTSILNRRTRDLGETAVKED